MSAKLPERLTYEPSDGYIRGPNRETWIDVASLDPDGEAVASEIVRRYNAHAALVEALTMVVEVIETGREMRDLDGTVERIERAARAALKGAKS